MITILAGGIGGAKLVEGVARVRDPASLTVIGNPGDDVERHGLAITPDLDIMTYTLAGIVNPEIGWGRKDDTYHCLESLGKLGEETWFDLGDMDLATHIFRTRLLSEGLRPTEVALRIASRLGVAARILPPSDDPVRTWVKTPAGWIGFEEFFVRDGGRPEILEVAFRGAEESAPTPEVLDALDEPRAILFSPSNPVSSLGPILAVPGIRDALERATCPRVAVSPFIGGRSLKGPTDRMMQAAGLSPTAVDLARYYEGLIDRMVIDEADAAERSALERAGLSVLVTKTLLDSIEEKARLAREILDWTRV